MAIIKNFLIEFKFFFVKSENCLHIFHTLFKDLHFFFKFNFLLGLVICILASYLLKLFILFCFLPVSFVLEILFSLLVDSEKFFNFLFVSFE